MITVSNTVEIARPPIDVFAYLADLEHIPEWNWAITSTSKITPGPVRVGTRYTQSRSVPRPAVETLEVTRLERGRRIELVGDLASFGAHLTYELSPTASGTRLVNLVELDPHGALGLLGGVVTGRIRASVGQNLSVLRTLLEKRSLDGLS